MISVAPFLAQAKSIGISVTDASSTSVSLPSKGNVIRLINEGYYPCYVSIGVGSQTATIPSGTAAATCTAIPAFSDLPFSISAGTDLEIAAICRSGYTTTLIVQVGEGI